MSLRKRRCGKPAISTLWRLRRRRALPARQGKSLQYKGLWRRAWRFPVPWFWGYEPEVLNQNRGRLRSLPLIPRQYPAKFRLVNTLEHRRSRRFELKLPVEVTRAGAERKLHAGETMNVSSGGILLAGEVDIPIGQSIEYYISLPTGSKSGDVRLRCMGKVLRKNNEMGTLAATLERYEFVRAC